MASTWRGQEDRAIDNMRNSNCNDSEPNNLSPGLSNIARCGQGIVKADIGYGGVMIRKFDVLCDVLGNVGLAADGLEAVM